MKRSITILTLALLAAPCGPAWAQLDTADSTVLPQPSTGNAPGRIDRVFVQRTMEDAEREVGERTVQIELSRRAAEAAVRDLERVRQQQMLLFTDPGQTEAAALVIPRQEVDPGAAAEIEEDLAVMGRILSKAAGGGKGRRAMGIAVQVNALGSSGTPRNLYLEGYGALFFLNVDFPLVQPRDEDKPENNERASTEWESTRRELLSRGRDSTPWRSPVVPAIGGPGDEEYDGERLAELKQDLIAALKNAAHIRRLQNEESVTLVVTGRGNDRNAPWINTGGPARVPAMTGRPIGGRGGRMILRVSKADIMALQNKTISAEDFRDRVVVIGPGI